MVLIRFPKHKLHRCRSSFCNVCAGGLAMCVVCGGGEGSLPTECPGEKMDVYIADAVYDGWIDYTVRDGWHHPGRLWWLRYEG